MQKTILTIVLVALCLIFSNSVSIYAQDSETIDVTTKGIQIGQKVPDVLLDNIHNYKTTSAKLSDFKGKLLILDFWASWCSPCIAMIPKMEALQQQFKEKIQIVKVTYQTSKLVLPFLEKFQKGKPSNLPDITGDKVLHKLFPHVYLPHYVWINTEGTVIAITGLKELTSANIVHVLNNKGKPGFKQKRDLKIAFDTTKPMLVNGNAGNGSGIIYHAVFSKYIPGLHSGYTKKKKDSIFSITSRNESIPHLFSVALGEGKRFFPRNRIKLEVKDTAFLTSNSKGPEYQAWLQDHSFCYEVIVPAHLEKQAYQIMQQDLNRLIDHYTASVLKRTTRCLGLVSITDKIKPRSKGGKPEVVFNIMGCHLKNVSVNHLISRLDAFYMQESTMPIINATGYSGPVDLDINASLSDLKAINRELEKYGLKFTAMNAEVEMMVVNDK